MEGATWLIAAASVVNVVVLGVYAWFTYGIWRETQRSARRTEELAQQARDALRMQIVAFYLDETRQSLQPSKGSSITRELRAARAQALSRFLEAAFPDYWPDVKQIIEGITDHMVEKFGAQE